MIRSMTGAGLAACAFLLSAAVPPAAEAGAFTVVPTRVYFGLRDRAQAVTVINDGDTPLAIQSEMYSWRIGPDGIDQLVPTDDLIMAPPVARIAPKSQQVFRLALLRAIDPQRQLSYRLVVRELPELGQPAGNGMSVPVTLAVTLPVFVTPPMANWSVECSANRKSQGVQVLCRNAGNSFTLIARAELKRGDQLLGRFLEGAYLLPHAERAINLSFTSSPTAGPAALVLTYEDGKTETLELTIP